MRYFSYLVLLFMSATVCAQDLADYSAQYEIQMNGLQAGELNQQLETLTDGLHRFRSATKAKGVVALFKRDTVKETSLWTLSQQQIKPRQYLYQRNGGKKDKYLRMDFDWRNRSVHIDDKVHPWDLEIENGTLEKHVYQVQLRLDLLQNPQQKTFNYLIADGGHLKHYQIKRLEQENTVQKVRRFYMSSNCIFDNHLRNSWVWDGGNIIIFGGLRRCTRSKTGAEKKHYE